jgi:hypothetical protein
MPTPEQQRLVDAMSAALAGDADVEAAWLAGSLGKGGGDAFSDVDVLALCADGAWEAVSLRWQAGVGRIAEPALVAPLYGGRVVNVVTVDWERFDVTFVHAAELGRYDAAQLTPLFNRTGRAPASRDPAPYRPSPQAVTALVTEFLRVIGLSPVAFGRGEHIISLSGVEMLRTMTLNLFLEINGVSPEARGGALKRNPFLTREQRDALEALPPVAAKPESLLAANRALTALFLPVARQLASEIGAEWPEKLEAATRKRLLAVFGDRAPTLG